MRVMWPTTELRITSVVGAIIRTSSAAAPVKAQRFGITAERRRQVIVEMSRVPAKRMVVLPSKVSRGIVPHMIGRRLLMLILLHQATLHLVQEIGNVGIHQQGVDVRALGLRLRRRGSIERALHLL